MKPPSSSSHSHHKKIHTHPRTVLVSAPAVFRHPLAGPFPASPFDEGFVPPPFVEDLRGKVNTYMNPCVFWYCR